MSLVELKFRKIRRFAIARLSQPVIYENIVSKTTMFTEFTKNSECVELS